MNKPVDLRWKHISRMTRWVLSIVVFLIVVRLVLPFGVASYVNRKLNASRHYGGRIGEVDMQLWRGGYQIHQVQIHKKSGGVPAPWFAARTVDLSIQWRELFHGALVGEVIVQEPRINIVSGATEERTQTGKEVRWDKLLESLFPFQLNRVEIASGEVHFQNPFSQPPVDIYTSRIFATATNLTNSRDSTQKLPAGVEARAMTIGGGEVNLHLQMNLMASQPAFEMNCGLTNTDLVALNDFLRAYGKFDVERGRFALYTSVAAENGTYEGYFKVFFEDLDVFAWEKERQKNIVQGFWQAIVGGVTTAFKNHPRDRLATKIPISGSYSNSSVGVLSAVGTLLQNAFVKALVPKLDQPVTLEQVNKKNGSK